MGGDIKIMISDNIYVTTMKYVNIMIIITIKYMNCTYIHIFTMK